MAIKKYIKSNIPDKMLDSTTNFTYKPPKIYNFKDSLIVAPKPKAVILQNKNLAKT